MTHLYHTEHKQAIDLIENNKKLIYKVANSYCQNIVEQEDLIQEIVFQLIKSFPTFDAKVKATTWMYRVALNVSISYARKLQTRQKYLVPMPDKLISIAEPDTPELDEDVKMLNGFIQEFNPISRAVLIMYLDGNSHQQIADALGISVSNVGTKIGRIKKELKKKFKQQKNEQ